MSPASRTSSCATTSATARRRRKPSVFRSVYLKSLRDYRVPILGWGLGLGALMATVLVAVPTVFATPAAKAAVVALGASYAWVAEPIKIDTAGGYATWKYGITILVVVIWPLLAGTGMLRGEEERGSMDVLLSAPRGRVRVALEKLAALWTALLIFGVVVGLLTFAGGAKLNGEITLGGTLAFGLHLALIGAPFGTRALPTSDWSLRSLYARSLGMIATSTLWWTLVIALLAAWLVIIVKQTETQLRSLLQGSNVFAQVIKLGGADTATNEAILGALFLFLPILLMAFAVTQANRWSADEEEGLLEIVLSTPQPRLRVLLVRFSALATATIFISVVTLIAATVASAVYGVALDYGNLAAAALSMIPLGLLVAALGYLFAGWLRAALDTGLLSFLLVIWFFISFIGPSLKLPDAIEKASPFFYYGTPLLHGWQLGDLLVVVAAGAVALALASYRFARKDIAA